MEIELASMKMLNIPEDPTIPVNGMLYFLDGQYLFRYRGEHGMESKFVTAIDLAAAFSQSEQDTGWLTAGVVRCGSSSKGRWFVYSAPAQKIEISISGASGIEEIKVPFPRTVLFGLGTSYYLWASKDRYFDQYGELFRAPCANVYPDGRICWGQNTPGEADPQQARSIWEMFFRTPFNQDLGNGKSQKEPNAINEMLRNVAGKASYPLSDLVKMSTSVGQAINYLLEER